MRLPDQIVSDAPVHLPAGPSSAPVPAGLAANGLVPLTPGHGRDRCAQPGRANGSATATRSSSDVRDAQAAVPGIARAMAQDRRRHASFGATAKENGAAASSSLIENGAVRHRHSENYNIPSSSCRDDESRARHSSGPGGPASGSSSPGMPSKYSTPCQSAHFPINPLVLKCLHEPQDSIDAQPCNPNSNPGASVSSGANVLPKKLGPSGKPVLPQRDSSLPALISPNTVIHSRPNGVHCGPSNIGPHANGGQSSPDFLNYDKSPESEKLLKGDARNVTMDPKIPRSDNYVPCVEFEKHSSEASVDDAPRRGDNYTEFTFDKSSVTTKPKGFVQSLYESPARKSEPRSEASSILSLNFNWKKNYVPFGCARVEEVKEERVEASSRAPLMKKAAVQDDDLSPSELKQDFLTAEQVGPGSGWSWRDEFALSNLRLDHPAPHLLVSAQWQQHSRMSCLYLGYRLFWALYFLTWSVWSLVGFLGHDAPWSLKLHYFTYLTNWSIWLLAADTALQTVNVVMHMRRMADMGDHRYGAMTAAQRVSWAASNVSFSAHVFITLAYWITVYPYRGDQALSVISINTHLVPGAYVLLDAVTAATPRRLLHAWHPVAYFSAYVAFNVIYYVCGGTDYMGRVALYPFMDWSVAGQSVLVVGAAALLLMPLLHALLCSITAVRVRLWRRYAIARYLREGGDIERHTKYNEQIV
ncbi:uncharacterized protein LOC108665492 isoform X2 [Hyalella azteca]|uniref:Uncharacterized protein LOC108665492 isoform X2 n=1 Tax=Hyalella azteca TaxID=294128 RepID=A0A8B7N1L7_HYAAZ|nr:uncharacterized protein LOC108665492 isoform X2 [Hyalella azteca]